MTITIAIASDHGGFEMKSFIKQKLINKGYEVADYGTNSTESVDYPDYAEKVSWQRKRSPNYS